MTTEQNAASGIKSWPAVGETVLRLLMIIALLGVMLVLANNSLPDYVAYETLFLDDVSSYQYNRVFHFAAQLSKYLQMDYLAFRFLILLSGIVTFAFIAKVPRDGDRYARNAIAFYGFYFLVILPFIFEFYDVRLRAGVSCLLFALAFVPEVASTKKSTNVFFRLAQALLMAASLLLHASTFATIVLFCVPPLLIVKYSPEWLKPLKGLVFVALAMLWIGFLYQVVMTVPSRGEAFFSPLNPARFYALVAIPLALFVIFDLPASRADKNIGLGMNRFPLLFTINYLMSAVVLAGFFFTGNLAIAGEAIVRVMTLSSLPAVFVIARWGVGYGRMVPAYLLVCNGLFFINTVYL